MRVAALFPIGTSDGGCPVAISEILQYEPSLEVHMLYGKRAAPDAVDPKDVVARIKDSLDDERVTWAGCQQVEPFDLSEAYKQVRAFVASISERNYERVYVGITGATNPVVTSLFQSAMAYLSCQVVPIYVQARGTALVQHFLASDVRDRVTAEEALSTARSGQVRVAARLAERLPSDGPWKFLRSSLAALAHWDDFDYSQARQTLEHQARKAGEYATDPLLAAVADTVARLAANADEMSAFAKELCDRQNFGTTATTLDWTGRVSRIGVLLVADALANAQRRIVEGRFTDSVLRSYRAAECAMQMRLFAIGIHPSQPVACQAAYERYQLALPSGGSGMAFKAGLEFLDSIREVDFSTIKDHVMKLGATRNYTYLEHGYQRVQSEQAKRCFELSLLICQHLLGRDVDKWKGFEMRF